MKRPINWLATLAILTVVASFASAEVILDRKLQAGRADEPRDQAHAAPSR